MAWIAPRALTDLQEADAYRMWKSGMSQAAIGRHFLTTYGVKVSRATVCRIVHRLQRSAGSCSPALESASLCG